MGWYASLTVVGHLRLVSLSMRTPKVILHGSCAATSVSATSLSTRAFSMRVPNLEWSRTSTLGLTVGSWTASRGRVLTTRSACRRDMVASSGIVTVQSLRPTVYLRGKGRMMGAGGQISARPGHPRSKIGLAPRGECRGGRARVRGHSLSGYQMPRSDDIAVVVLELQPIRHVDRNARGEVRRR